MSLPRRVQQEVARALAEKGLGSRIERVVEVGGGCINHGARLQTDGGTQLFVKWNASAPPGMFEAEADGLAALARPAALRVPAPLAWTAATGPGGPSWLLLEYVAPGRPSREAEARLGSGLARIHGASSAKSFGWRGDNWIGSLPQANDQLPSWGDFWRDRRLAPQLDAARAGGHLRDRVFDVLLDLTPDALTGVDRPELVHGDLWGGNWFADAGGEPVLIDPAVYHGHGEVDLAMSELFGGFGSRFYESYREVHPVAEAYAAYRRDLYQIYYLLVHVNLFGASYEARSLAAARRVTAVLSG